MLNIKNGNGHQSYGKGGLHQQDGWSVRMAMAMMAMARVGCASKLVSKSGNGHDTDSKDGMHKQDGQ